MPLEAIILAVASIVRPTSLAAVYALLAAPQARRLLAVYILAGAAFSVLVGILVVVGFHGASLERQGRSVTAVVELLAGVAALGFAAGVAGGRVAPQVRAATTGEGSWATRKLRRPSVLIAAAAGAATHPPGLFYLVALNAIVADRPDVAGAVVQVLVYNAIWFSGAIAALAFSYARPARTRQILEQVSEWARLHDRGILVLVFALVGAYLTVTGITSLAG